MTPVVRPLRPPTAAYPDLGQVAEFSADYVGTALGRPQVILLNLEGGFFGAAQVVQLILPLREALKGPNAGSVAAVVVSSDADTRFLIEKIAEENDIPLFVADSIHDPFAGAHPVGLLTDSEYQALELIPRMGGAVTSSGFGRVLGIEANAAGNRLTSLAKKGYIFKVQRSRREGNLFMDPRALPQQTTSVDEPSAKTLAVPDELESAVEALAAAQDREPAELLAQAWTEFQAKHHAALARTHAKAAGQIREGDHEALAELEKSHAQRRASAAMKRIDSD